jgi:hypothetical protein
LAAQQRRTTEAHEGRPGSAVLGRPTSAVLSTATSMSNDKAAARRPNSATSGSQAPPQRPLSALSTASNGRNGNAVRTRDQPGLWREVTAVAAEDTLLLCLTAADYGTANAALRSVALYNLISIVAVSVLDEVRAELDDSVAAFLARVPLVAACCTAKEVRRQILEMICNPRICVTRYAHWLRRPS